MSDAERSATAVDAGSGTQFVDAASYAPPGELQSLIAGQVSGGFGGVTESHSYNKRLEYTSTQATSSTGTALNLSLGYNLPGGDNGTVTSITNNVDNGRTQNLGYDPLNRISSAATQATSGTDCWGQNFTPDALANLNTIGVSQCSAGSLSVTVDGNNHINVASYAYDASGNMTQDGTGNTYTFDAENRLTQASGMVGGPYCYVYDGNGLRVAKISGSSGGTCTGGTVVMLYWRSLSGDALAETDGTGSTTNSYYNEYVFFDGRRVASRNGSGAIFYWFADQVGSTRSITTGNGPGQTSGQLCYDADFTPYGQELDHTEHLQTTGCPPNYRFTGYEYDGETGLYYAFARYYSSRLGRFLSTDPLGGSIGNMQSENAYSYVQNDPTNFVDPVGAYLVGPQGTPGGAPGGAESDSFNPFLPNGIESVYGWLAGENGDADWGQIFWWVLGGQGALGSSSGGGSCGPIGCLPPPALPPPPPECIFNIRINNRADISASQISEAESQIEALFGPNVGADFPDSGPIDYSLNFVNAGGNNSNLGQQTSFLFFQGTPAVYVNNISNAFVGYPSSTVGTVFGTVGAHELFHRIAGVGDIPFNSANPADLMSIDSNPNGGTALANNLLSFTASEQRALLAKCNSIHH